MLVAVRLPLNFFISTHVHAFSYTHISTHTSHTRAHTHSLAETQACLEEGLKELQGLEQSRQESVARGQQLLQQVTWLASLNAHILTYIHTHIHIGHAHIHKSRHTHAHTHTHKQTHTHSFSWW